MLLSSADPLKARTEQLAATGRRVLLLARGWPLGSAPPEPVAVVCLADELRPDVQETLRYLREQGVELKVISGAHPATVATLAARVGIDTTAPVDARKLPVGDAEWPEIVERSNVFGRVTPEQKRRIVRVLQLRGHVVAMTGDGVNDILAMKDADVGLAMRSGSAATRAVAQLVLLDASFRRCRTSWRRGGG